MLSKYLLAGAIAMATGASAIDPIIVKNRHFYNSKTNEPFFMRGIDYQPGGAGAVTAGKDPLSDADICARDIKMFQTLGLNTVRVYSIDPLVNHDECMSQLAAAGIYLVLDVNSPLPNQHINANEPWTTYHEKYLEHVFTVMEVFAGYPNTLTYIAGNEVVFEGDSAEYSPRYVKAVVRDMKAYIKNHFDRPIPVGYAHADVIDFRISMPAYLTCGPEEETIDWFGVNSYQWCGNADFEGSGYDILVEDYTNFTRPIFFSEFGCNEVRPRVFTEIEALYSDQMTGVFSGGLLYEYSQEANDYGIVEIDKSGNIQMMEEFDTLREQYSNAPEATIPSGSDIERTEVACASSYANIEIDDLPETQGGDMIENGVPAGDWTRGRLMASDSVKTTTSKTIKDADGNEITDKAFKVTNGFAAGPATGSGGNKKGAASTLKGGIYGAASAAVFAVAFFML